MQDCEGFRKLVSAVERDEVKWPRAHNYREKLEWVVARAKHYADKTGLTPEAILDAWEKRRDYWYMNYYQDANQPAIEADRVRVFETVADLLASVGSSGFRCPHCGGVSKSPYECDSGVLVNLMNSKSRKKEPCDWKVYGLFGHMGNGIAAYVKEKMALEKLFMPIAWEKEQGAPPARPESEALKGHNIRSQTR
jgi:hypothetical protein